MSALIVMFVFACFIYITFIYDIDVCICQDKCWFYIIDQCYVSQM